MLRNQWQQRKTRKIRFISSYYKETPGVANKKDSFNSSLNVFPLILISTCFQEGTLKWNSQEMTKANTIQASKKLRNRWPCQKFRVSDVVVVVPPGAAAADMASLASFHCSISSASFAPATFCAIDPQISHVLWFRLYQVKLVYHL